MLHALYKPTECKTTLFHKCHHLRLWPSCFAFVSHPSATPSPHFSGMKPSFLPGKRQNQRALWSLTSHVLVTPHLLDAVNLFFYPHDIWMQKTCAWLYECVCAWPCSLQFGRGSKEQQLAGEWWFVGDLEGGGSREPPASAVTSQKSHIEAFLRMEPWRQFLRRILRCRAIQDAGFLPFINTCVFMCR